MNLRNENAAEFLFLPDQKLKSIPDKMSENDLVCQIIQTIMQFVDRFTPGKEYFTTSQNQNDWMNNKSNMQSMKVTDSHQETSITRPNSQKDTSSRQ